jgi:hypothetical protein
MSIYNSNNWIIDDSNEKQHIEIMKTLSFLNPQQFYDCPPIAFNTESNKIFVNQAITFSFDTNERKNDMLIVTDIIKERYGLDTTDIIQEYILTFDEFRNTISTYTN